MMMSSICLIITDICLLTLIKLAADLGLLFQPHILAVTSLPMDQEVLGSISRSVGDFSSLLIVGLGRLTV